MRPIPLTIIAASALLLAGEAFAQAGVQAGVSAAVRGEVQVASLPDRIGRNIRSGEEIFMLDRIRSSANSGLQILLMDETVFTIGANSELVIDRFIYDPNSQNGQVAASVVKGAFRFITGKVAKNRPRNMTVKFPSGSMGVRGTIVAGQVKGDQSLVVLLGPGSNTNTSERVGSIEVSNAGETVELNRAGFATIIPGDGVPPTEPFELPTETLNALTETLSAGEGTTSSAEPTSGQNANNSNSSSNNRTANNSTQQSQQQRQPQQQQRQPQQQQQSPQQAQTSQSQLQTQSTGSGGGTVAQQAGQTQATGGENALAITNLGTSRDQQQNLAVTAVHGDTLNLVGEVENGTTTIDDLRLISSGTHSYVVDTAFVQTKMNGADVNLPGNVKVVIEVDFGSRTFGGGASGITIDTTSGGGNISFTDNIVSESYDEQPGTDKFSHTYDSSDPHTMDPFQIDGSKVAVKNDGGVPAQHLVADMKYDDRAGNVGLGKGQSPDRTRP